MTDQKPYILKSLVLFIVLSGINNLNARAQSQVKEINVRQRMPEVEINNMLNYKTPAARLSDFKGKLLILDFWATYCAPCISMFPKTDSLEKSFDGKVQFLSITNEPKTKVIDFLKRMYDTKHIKPVSVFSDTLFSQFFPYSSIPYYVWIDRDGRVVATTTFEEITAKNIKNILEGKPVGFENWKDIRNRKLNIENSAFVLSNNFQLKDSLAKRDEISRKDVFSYSIATKSVGETGGHLYFDTSHFSAVNASISFLYRFYYDAGYYDAPVQGAFDSKVSHVYEIKDPKLLNNLDPMDDINIKSGTSAMKKWLRDNSVCYEIVYPCGLTWKQKMTLVKKDLDRYFAEPMGFEVHVEQRIDTNTSILRRINNKVFLGTAGKNPEEHHDRYTYVQENMPLSHLISLLNSYFFQGKMIVFGDKTGLTKPVDLELTCDMTKIQSINAELAKYGLKFSKEPSKIDVLVFSDAKH